MKKRFLSKLSIKLFGLFAAISIAQADETRQFLSIADIHFNPFTSCKISFKACPLLNKLRAAPYQQWDNLFAQVPEQPEITAGHDTNYALLRLALSQWHLVDLQEHPQFGILVGDYLAHEFRAHYIAYTHDTSAVGYQAFVKKTLQFLTYKIHQACPDIDFYPAIGNNDTYTGDYTSVTDGKFFQDVAPLWLSIIHDKDNRARFSRDFFHDGYYAVKLPQTNQQIIVLNSVLFSAKAPHKEKSAAQQELKWLHQQLALAEKQRDAVMIVLHIPIGIDAYATLKTGLSQVVEFWQPTYSALFRAEVNRFSATIKQILPAHIHRVSLQATIFDQLDHAMVNFTPSISPIFGNRPAFRLFRYDADTFMPRGTKTYTYLATQKWAQI